MKLKWTCKSCGDVVISDSEEHHKMDYCKCGKSGLNLEASLQRVFGQILMLGEVKEEVDDEVL